MIRSSTIDMRRPWLAGVLLAVVSAILTLAVAAAWDLPIRDPDGVAGSPFVRLSAILAVFFALDVLPRALHRARWRPRALRAHLRAVVGERWTGRRTLIVLSGLLSFYVTYVAYRNLKGFLPYLGGQLHDDSLIALDRDLTFGHDPATVLQSLLGTGISAQVLSVVYVFFLGFVPISLAAALVWGGNDRRGLWYATALQVNWLLGAASYYLIPSLGPAFVRHGEFADLPSTGVSALQQVLLDERLAALRDVHAAASLQSIAAFASLHVSIMFTAAGMAQVLRLRRPIRVALWVLFGLTTLSTVYFGWHYIVDDLAGLAIGALAIWASARMTGHRLPVPRLSARSLPNLLSGVRILLAPLVLVLALGDRSGSVAAALVFALGGLTDVADGHLARSRNTISTLGKLLDPLADKLLVGCALAGLVATDRLALWIALLIAGREVMVSLLRARAVREGVVIAASGLGKLKMAVQVAMVLVLLAVRDADVAAAQALVAVTIALTVASGWQYAADYRRRRAAVAPAAA